MSPSAVAAGLRRICLLALLALLILFEPPFALAWLVWPLVLIAGAVTAGRALRRRARPPWWGYVAHVALVGVAALASGAGVTAAPVLWQLCFVLLLWSVADEAASSGALPWVVALVVGLALLVPQLAGPQSVVVAGRVFTYRAVQQWSGYPELGLLCLLGLAAASALAAATASRALRAACLVVALTFAIGLGVVQSRAALVAAVAIVAWVVVAAAVRWRRWAGAVVVGLGLVVAVAAGVRQPSLRDRIVEAGASDRDRPVDMRVEYWRSALGSIRAHPWMGVGPGRFQDAVAREGRAAPPHAHNLFLHVAAETGLPAMLLYAWLWARVSIGTWRRSGTSLDGLALFAVHAMVLAFLLRSLTDHFLGGLDTSFRMTCLVAFLFGLGEGPVRTLAQEHSSRG